MGLRFWAMVLCWELEQRVGAIRSHIQIAVRDPACILGYFHLRPKRTP